MLNFCDEIEEKNYSIETFCFLPLQIGIRIHSFRIFEFKILINFAHENT